MMIYILFTLIIFLSIICYMNMRSTSIKNKLIENFENELYMDISEDDKQLYYTIIDTYELLLDRDPSEDELNYDFDQIKTNKSNLVDLHNKIKNSLEYKRLNDTQTNLASVPPGANNDVQDTQLVMSVLRELMPQSEPEYDNLYIDYVVMKYRSNNKDKDKLIEYLKKTPEYADYLKAFPSTKNDSDKNNSVGTESSECSTKKTDSDDTLKINSENLKESFEFSRPEIGKTTAKIVEKVKSKVDSLKKERVMDDIPEDEKSCVFYNQYKELQSSKQLSDYQHKRNMEQLKYHCNMSKVYANVDENLKLLPDQSWSVPQKHPPVCTSGNSCAVHDSVSQTGLIGTLLDDVSNNSKILPSFEYKESD